MAFTIGFGDRAVRRMSSLGSKTYWYVRYTNVAKYAFMCKSHLVINIEKIRVVKRRK